jgi:hypothetical protein
MSDVAMIGKVPAEPSETFGLDWVSALPVYDVTKASNKLGRKILRFVEGICPHGSGVYVHRGTFQAAVSDQRASNNTSVVITGRSARVLTIKGIGSMPVYLSSTVRTPSEDGMSVEALPGFYFTKSRVFHVRWKRVRHDSQFRTRILTDLCSIFRIPSIVVNHEDRLSRVFNSLTGSSWNHSLDTEISAEVECIDEEGEWFLFERDEDLQAMISEDDDALHLNFMTIAHPVDAQAHFHINTPPSPHSACSSAHRDPLGLSQSRQARHEIRTSPLHPGHFGPPRPPYYDEPQSRPAPDIQWSSFPVIGTHPPMDRGIYPNPVHTMYNRNVDLSVDGTGMRPPSKTSLPPFADSHFSGSSQKPGRETVITGTGLSTADETREGESASDFIARMMNDRGDYTIILSPLLKRLIASATQINPSNWNDLLATLAKEGGLPPKAYLVSKLTNVGGIYPGGLNDLRSFSKPMCLAGSPTVPNLSSDLVSMFPDLQSTDANGEWQMERDRVCAFLSKIISSFSVWDVSLAFSAAWTHCVEPAMKPGSKVIQDLERKGLSMSAVPWWDEWQESSRELYLHDGDKFSAGFEAAIVRYSTGQANDVDGRDAGSYTVLRRAVGEYCDELWRDENRLPGERSMFTQLEGQVSKLCKKRLRLDTQKLISHRVIQEEARNIEQVLVNRWPKLQEIVRRSYASTVRPSEYDSLMHSAAMYHNLFSGVRQLKTFHGSILPMDFVVPPARSKSFFLLPDFRGSTQTASVEGNLRQRVSDLEKALSKTLANPAVPITHGSSRDQQISHSRRPSVSVPGSSNPVSNTTISNVVSTTSSKRSLPGFNSTTRTVPGFHIAGFSSADRPVGSVSTPAISMDPEVELKDLLDKYPEWWAGKWNSPNFYPRWEFSDSGWLFAYIINRVSNKKTHGPSPAPAGICILWVFSCCPAGRRCLASHPEMPDSVLVGWRDYCKACGLQESDVWELINEYSTVLSTSTRKYWNNFAGKDSKTLLKESKDSTNKMLCTEVASLSDHPSVRILVPHKGSKVSESIRSKIGNNIISRIGDSMNDADGPGFRRPSV